MRNKGFTLVELMVVISIVAVLATIGFTLFQTTQASARDAKRRADVDAMSTALETHFDATAGTYTALDATWFSDGVVPSDSLNSGDYIYTTTMAADSTTYAVCAKLERSGGNYSDNAGTTPASGGDYYCKISQQQ